MCVALTDTLYIPHLQHIVLVFQSFVVKQNLHLLLFCHLALTVGLNTDQGQIQKEFPLVPLVRPPVRVPPYYKGSRCR